MNTMHNASYAHVADPRTAARLAHDLLRPSRPLEPAARPLTLARCASTSPWRSSCALLRWDAATRGARARMAAWAGASAPHALEPAMCQAPRRLPSHFHLRVRGGRV